MKVPAWVSFALCFRRCDWHWKPRVYGEWGANWNVSWLCFGAEAVWT